MLQKISKTKLIGILAAVAGISTSLFVAPTPVRADNRQYLYEVTSQLIRAAIASGLRGYKLSHEPRVNTLYHDRSHYIPVYLRAGWSYGIVGVCDRDCRDLDIALYDHRGNLIRSDLANDDTPTVTITPYRTGTYRVRVDMANCQSSLCYYGVGVFAR